MATARDKLVADWRQQLHAAQDALASSPRQAWMAGVRCRLYRFLLACYAKSPWTIIPARPDSEAAVIFDDAQSQFLHGKPARSAGKIQAVLKSVAGAQPPAHDSVAIGIGDHSYYVPLAAASASSNTQRAFAALKQEGLAVRQVIRNGVDVLEVRATDYYRAQWLVSCYEASRATRFRRTKWTGEELVGYFGAALATAPFIAWFAAMLAAVARGAHDEVVAGVFCAVGSAWFVGMVAYQSLCRYWYMRTSHRR